MEKQSFISVGSRADLGALLLIARDGQDVDWTVPSGARVGDRLYLIIPSYSGPVQAFGTIEDEPYKTQDFGGRYRATVGSIEVLEIPVRLDDLRERFPAWDYLNKPQSYCKIPPEYAGDFQNFVMAYQDVPDWKALMALESRERVLVEAVKTAEPEEDLIDYEFIDEEQEEERIFVSIKARRGQADFRALLRIAYQDTCAITGYKCPDALEAAHIIPYQSRSSNQASNGLLLRADIHTLFDLQLIGIDEEQKVVLSPVLQGSSYGYLHGKKTYLPQREEHLPDFVALKKRLMSLR